jgi:hypothetical protein
MAAGAAAWLAGAAAATGLSVLAVSRLSGDAGTVQGAPMSPAEVSRALVAMAATPSGSGGPSTPGPATPSPDAPATGPSGSGPSGATAPGGSAVAPTTSPASQVVQQPSQTVGEPAVSERRLADPGGYAVARCQGGQAYLVSWSPAQGFQVGYTQRGPSHVVTVVFVGAARSWPLRVACVGGDPTRVSDDDGVGDH